MANSRTKNVALNIITKTFTSLALVLIRLWSRTVFFSCLGEDLLGINSLFQDVLTILSFADLGFSTVLMVEMYKPLAENNIQKIQALLELSKKIYKYVILAITLFGIFTIPVLYFVNTTTVFSSMILYYSLYLINNIITYIGAYKETYLQAKQQQYKLFYLNFTISLATVIFKTLLLLWTKDYMIYLIAGIFFTAFQKYMFIKKINSLCPEVIFSHAEDVDMETKKDMKSKVKAMLVQKISNLGINQTDSFIVSIALTSSTWGIVSNYNLIKTSIANILTNVIYAMIPSMGDLMNSESKEKQLKVFYQYDFLNNWMYTFLYIELFILSNSVISFMFNNSMTLRPFEVFIFFLSFYLQGLRDPINVMRESSGLFEKDQWVNVVACVANLLSSIIFIKIFGLTGVFYGTIISTIIVIVFRTFIYFDNSYSRKHAYKYLMTIITEIVQTMLILIVCFFIDQSFLGALHKNIFLVILYAVLLAIIINVLFILMNIKNNNLKELFGRFRYSLSKIRK